MECPATQAARDRFEQDTGCGLTPENYERVIALDAKALGKDQETLSTALLHMLAAAAKQRLTTTTTASVTNPLGPGTNRSCIQRRSSVIAGPRQAATAGDT